MKKVEIYDSSTIDTLKWPETEEGHLARNYLLPLIKEGPEHYITNAKTRLYILTVDDLILPISVNEREYENSYLLSSYFVVENLKEKLKQGSGFIKALTDPLIGLFSRTLKWMKVNKVVIINNWLLTTNLYPDLSKDQIQSITAFLKRRFPDHYLMFRSINKYKSSTVYDGLNIEKYRMIPSRHVYLYDPSRTLSSNTIRKQKQDTNKMRRSDYEVETVDTLSEAEITRLLELDQNVYVSKYTKYSPLYTEKYLREAIKKKTMSFKLLKKDDQIYGVIGFIKKNGFLLTSFFGYDTALPQEEGLYRILSAVIMQEIDKVKLISHQGSGAANFKKWRGCQEEQEYVAIYARHLPFLRRLFWSLGEKITSKLQR